MPTSNQILGQSPADFFWRIFLIWATVGLIVTGLDIGVVTVKSWSLPAPLQSFFLQCLLWGDFLFMAFSSLVLLFLYERWVGWIRALLSCLLLGFCGAMAEWVGTKTGFPFGDYHYTENMGPMIGGQLPWAIPLAWWSVVGALHQLSRSALPALNPWKTGLVVAAAATAFDWVMEPYAWQLKVYWIWHDGHVPLLNYLSWFFFSFVFSLILTALGAFSQPGKQVAVPRAAWLLGLMMGVFILGRLAN